MTCGEAFSAFKKLYSEDQYFHIALTQLLPTVQKTLNATDVVRDIATAPNLDS